MEALFHFCYFVYIHQQHWSAANQIINKIQNILFSGLCSACSVMQCSVQLFSPSPTLTTHGIIYLRDQSTFRPLVTWLINWEYWTLKKRKQTLTKFNPRRIHFNILTNFDEKMNLIHTSLKLLLISMTQVTLTTRIYSQSPFIFDYERIQNISIVTELFPKFPKKAEQKIDFYFNFNFVYEENTPPDREEEDEGKFWYSEVFFSSEVVRRRPVKVVQMMIFHCAISTIFFNFVATWRNPQTIIHLTTHNDEKKLHELNLRSMIFQSENNRINKEINCLPNTY